MSDEPRADGEEPTAGTSNAMMILLRIAIMFGVIPIGIMVAAEYLF